MIENGTELQNPETYFRRVSSQSVIRVCHLISGDLWAGAEVQVVSLLSALRRRNDVGVSAIVLNEGRLADELRHADIDVCVVPEDRNSFARILADSERFIRQQGPQVLHSHRYKENLIAMLLSRKCKVPVTIRTQHGFPEPFNGIRGLRHCGVQWLDRWCGRVACDGIISVSEEMLSVLKRIYGSRVVLVRNGIDTERVYSRLTQSEAKRKLHLREDVPVFGFVGRLETIKRPDLFLTAAAVLSRRFQNAEFVLAGAGGMLERLNAQAEALAIGDRVHFLGHRDDVFDVLRSFNVLVMCSDHEGLPMALLEALWLQVPVVGRSVGGIKEVLGENEYGLTVGRASVEELADACRQLIEQHGLREKIVSAARKRIAEEFSVERCGDEIVGLYARLLRSKNVETT